MKNKKKEKKKEKEGKEEEEEKKIISVSPYCTKGFFTQVLLMKTSCSITRDER